MGLKKFCINVYAGTLFGIVTCLAVLLFPLVVTIDILSGKSLSQSVRLFVRLYGWVLVRSLSSVIPIVVENRPGDLPLPVIFVANHCSAIDPYLFGALDVENAFVTSWPFRIPVYNLAMKMARYIDSRSGWEEIETEGKRLLAAGCSLVIWPEGHRSRDGKLRRFRKGAFKLALAADRPVVPVCILGSGEVLPPGRKLLSPGQIKMIVLPPVYLEGEKNADTAPKELMRKARRLIEQEIAYQQRNPAAAGGAA